MPTAFSTGAPRGATTHSMWNSFFIFGLAGEATVDAAALCPNGIAVVETYSSVGQVLLSLLTIGIYAPRTIEVTCAAGAADNHQQPSKVLIGRDSTGSTLYVAKQDSNGAIDIVYQKSGGNR